MWTRFRTSIRVVPPTVVLAAIALASEAGQRWC